MSKTDNNVKNIKTIVFISHMMCYNEGIINKYIFSVLSTDKGKTSENWRRKAKGPYFIYI